MVLETVDGRFGGRQSLDVEALEQRSRAKGRALQGGADHVEVVIGRRLVFLTYPDRGQFAKG
jgi:hypothetical protein